MVHANGLYFLPYLADVTDNFVSFVCFFVFGTLLAFDETDEVKTLNVFAI